MLSKLLQLTAVSLCCAALIGQTGCACPSKACVTEKKVTYESRGLCERKPGEIAAELPPAAKPGECWAKVWVPPEFKTVTERVCVREASERLEVVPAKYETVEERVMVKDASTTLEVEPAEFATREKTIQVQPAHTEWEVNKECKRKVNEPVSEVFCLVNHPPAERTVRTECMVKPARVKEVCIPAQYETVKREKLACPATTKRVCIPAEFDTVDKTVKVCDGRMAWQRVICDREHENLSVNSNPAPAPAPTLAASTPDSSIARVAPNATANAHRKHRK